MTSERRPGDVLNGRYVLADRLGKGSMGSVWRAHDNVLERTVAVKELLSNPYGGEPMEVRLERVRREALALAKVEHPAIVTVHDLIFVRSPEDPWIVMGYVHGSPLDKLLEAGARLPAQQVAAIGLAVLEGLMACHRRSVYHRDVKPANIVVGDDGSVRLVDFGIVQMAGKESLTAPSCVLGTPEFLAPETLEKDPKVGPATDLWALAVTLYCALTGKAPFRAETLGATYAAIVSKTPPTPRVGGPLAALVMQMLSKRPADRPDTAKAAAILRNVAGLPDPVGREYRTGSDRTPEWRSKLGYTAPPGPARLGDDTQPVLPGQRPALLSGLYADDAARMVVGWPADRAAAELLALDPIEAARILNQCVGPVGGAALSAIAAAQPRRARKILEIVMVDRAGRLLDHMSSVSAAAALTLPPAKGAALRLAEADTSTVVGVLTEMPAEGAAPLVQAMDEARAVDVLGAMPDPAAVAAILLHVRPALRGQTLLGRLPDPFRALVGKHMQNHP
jgi:tRNA A-37 threonylcarbamoyl transferase component Bud32